MSHYNRHFGDVAILSTIDRAADVMTGNKLLTQKLPKKVSGIINFTKIKLNVITITMIRYLNSIPDLNLS